MAIKAQFFALAMLVAALCVATAATSPALAQEDPAEVQIGERLFLETRFAQFFAAHFDGDVNHPLIAGDPVLNTSAGVKTNFPGPFAAQSMNCRACHLVDELGTTKGAGNRTYGDFARRSPIPDRGDGKTTSLRNSPPLVNASLDPARSLLLHLDGQFSSLEDLVSGTFTGRNFGWLPDERAQAVRHIAAVIRGDDGTAALDKDYENTSYRRIFLGGSDVPKSILIPQQYRIAVDLASDEQILAAVSKLVAVYVRQLIFAQNSRGEFSGSPYDRFLSDNRLPRAPKSGESDLIYARRLAKLIARLDKPKFVSSADGKFTTPFPTSGNAFRFGPAELQGLKLFLREANGASSSSSGNCVGCHTPPRFTDSSFHNTGASQQEFDRLHGTGKFAALNIPSLANRNANPDIFLPRSAAHPASQEVFDSVPSAGDPQATDLGVWNMLANPEVPIPQQKLVARLRASSGNSRLSLAQLLDRSAGRFKTPGLRDLDHSAPYMHHGQVDDLIGVIHFYMQSSKLAKARKLRNGDSLISGIRLSEKDAESLARFLRSLNEDYS